MKILALILALSTLNFANSLKKSTEETPPKETIQTAVWLDLSVVSLPVNRDASLNIVNSHHHFRVQYGNWGTIELFEQNDNYNIIAASYLYNHHVPGSNMYYYGGLGIGHMDGVDVLEDTCVEDDGWFNDILCKEKKVNTLTAPITFGLVWGNYFGLSLELQAFLNQEKKFASLKIGVPLGKF